MELEVELEIFGVEEGGTNEEGAAEEEGPRRDEPGCLEAVGGVEEVGAEGEDALEAGHGEGLWWWCGVSKMRCSSVRFVIVVNRPTVVEAAGGQCAAHDRSCRN